MTGVAVDPGHRPCPAPSGSRVAVAPARRGAPAPTAPPSSRPPRRSRHLEVGQDLEGALGAHPAARASASTKRVRPWPRTAPDRAVRSRRLVRSPRLQQRDEAFGDQPAVIGGEPAGLAYSSARSASSVSSARPRSAPPWASARCSSRRPCAPPHGHPGRGARWPVRSAATSPPRPRSLGEPLQPPVRDRRHRWSDSRDVIERREVTRGEPHQGRALVRRRGERHAGWGILPTNGSSACPHPDATSTWSPGSTSATSASHRPCCSSSHGGGAASCTASRAAADAAAYPTARGVEVELERARTPPSTLISAPASAGRAPAGSCTRRPGSRGSACPGRSATPASAGPRGRGPRGTACGRAARRSRSARARDRPARRRRRTGRGLVATS